MRLRTPDGETVRHSLTAAWAISDERRLVLTSETTATAIDIDPRHVGLVKRLLDSWPKDDYPELEPLKTELIARGVIRPSVSSSAPSQARQIEYWRAFTDAADAVVERLDHSRVAIAGCGGIGSVVLQHLVGAGIGRYRLLDSDSVDESNLNRQFIYSRSSLGTLKVDAASVYIRHRRQGADVVTLAENWDGRSRAQRSFLVDEVDFILAAIDKPSIASSLDLLDMAWQAGVPSIMATVGLEKSLVSQLFDPRRSTRSPRETISVSSAIQRRPFLASHGPSNTLAATTAADQILNHLAGLHQRVDYERHLVLVRNQDGSPSPTRVEQVRL